MCVIYNFKFTVCVHMHNNTNIKYFILSNIKSLDMLLIKKMMYQFSTKFKKIKQWKIIFSADSLCTILQSHCICINIHNTFFSGST